MFSFLISLDFIKLAEDGLLEISEQGIGDQKGKSDVTNLNGLKAGEILTAVNYDDLDHLPYQPSK